MLLVYILLQKTSFLFFKKDFNKKFFVKRNKSD